MMSAQRFAFCQTRTRRFAPRLTLPTEFKVLSVIIRSKQIHQTSELGCYEGKKHVTGKTVPFSLE